MRIPILVCLTQASCAIGAGAVAFHGGATRHVSGTTNSTCHKDPSSSSSNAPTDSRFSHPGTMTCTPTGPKVEYETNPGTAPFNLILGIKEGYASGSYTTGVATDTTPAPGGSKSSRTFEVYGDISYMANNFGLTLEGGYASQGLDDNGDLGFSAWPITLIGSAAVGPLTAYAGIGYLKSASLGDTDLSGYRVIGGLKAYVFSLRNDEVGIYPRIELQSTRASADGGFSYSATGVSFAVELGF